MRNQGIFLKYFLPACFITIAMLISIVPVFAQPQKPPRPLKVTLKNAQGLQFGAFSQNGTGGTVAISSGGVRSASGGIMLLNLGYSVSTAVYSIDAEPGSVVNVVNGANSTLVGSNGGANLTLTLGSSSPTSPFVVPIGTTSSNPFTVYVGGTLTVPAGAVPGNFSGTFSMTFAQQ